MAAYEGISGINIGDGQGGFTALSLQERILRILADTNLSFRSATIMNAEEIGVGTVYFNVPELVATKDYGDGTGPTQQIQNGAVKVNIDKQGWVKYSYSLMDTKRMKESEQVLGQIAASMAISIENSLNAEFLDYMCKLFKTGGLLENSNQKVKLLHLPFKPATVANPTPDNMFDDFMQIEYTLIEMSTKFDKKQAGVPKDEIFGFVSPMVDTNMGLAFRNQPNELGNWQISASLVGKKLKNFKYFTDNQLQQKFKGGQSFSEKDYDFRGFAGFLLHNESVAFPVNFIQTGMVPNPENLDTIVICRYQYGIGAIRPQLIYALTYDVPNNK